GVIERHPIFVNRIDGGDVADLLQLVRRVIWIERVEREVHRVPDVQLQIARVRIEVGGPQIDGAVGRGQRPGEDRMASPKGCVMRVAEGDNDVVPSLVGLRARRLDAHAGGVSPPDTTVAYERSFTSWISPGPPSR